METNIRNKINKLSIREKQVFAAFCVAKYCSWYGIQHKYIQEYLLHLIDIVATNNLPKWEGKGGCLKISGRGDFLPEELNLLYGNNRMIEFDELTQYTTEVGIINLCGEIDNEPYEFLIKVISILEKNKIPDLKIMLSNFKSKLDNSKDWGDVVSENELATIKSKLLEIYSQEQRL